MAVLEAVGYLRISVKDQSTYSLDNQERQIRQYCQNNNLELTGIFKDDGQSSYSFDRPDFKALEKFIRANKKVEYLIIFDHDRFSRNLAEALIKIKEFQDKFGIKVLAISDDIKTDFSDPSTFMMRAFKFMMAESELHRIRKRTRDGYVQASLKGLYVNRAPIGYQNSRNKDGQPLLVIDEDKAPIIRLIFQEYNRGSTIEEVKKLIGKYNFPLKGNSAIQRILSNPVYAGLIKVPEHSGKPETTIRGIHNGIVNEQEYWQAKNRLTGNKRMGIHSNMEVPLKGVLQCYCGKMMSAGNSKSKSGRYYWYYVCSEHRKNLSATKLHSQFNEVLDLLSFDNKRIEAMSKIMGKEISQFLYVKAEVIAKAKKSLRQVEDKILQAEERYLLSDGSVNKKAYDKVMGSLKIQEKELQKRLRELQQGQETYWNKLNQILTALHDVRGSYDRLDFYKKQQFLNMVFYKGLTHDGKTFRTPSILKDFSHNVLILKEKGLLEVATNLQVISNNPDRTPNEYVLEHITRLYDVLIA